MKTLLDPIGALAPGLADIRTQYRVPPAFPAAVIAAAEAAAARRPADHVDRTTMRFVTLDPATSTDLDQAFAIEAAGGDLLLHYAIADVAWFVDDGGAIDDEAWTRGETLYLPDGKAGLYPPVLAERAASLLPDGPRPAVIFTVRVAVDGAVRLDGAERAIIRSSAKLAYDRVAAADLPAGFVDLADRIAAAETRRGASRVDPPEQEVSRTADGAGYALAFRPRLVSEDRNAALSLATNLAVADVLLAHHTGLFRVMAPPNPHGVARLRQTAAALRVAWPAEIPLDRFEKALDANVPAQAALMLAIRRAGEGAVYVPYLPGQTPWHAAMAATYAHATAPLRRLADRYVVRAALAIARGDSVPDAVTAAFARLPAAMARADGVSRQIEHAVIDLAEAVMLSPHVGERFEAIVTDVDAAGLRFQLRDLPIVARLTGGVAAPGDRLVLHLVGTDPARRTIAFAQAE